MTTMMTSSVTMPLLLPAQCDMEDAILGSEQGSHHGAVVENCASSLLGQGFQLLCCVCAGAGLCPNIITINQGSVGLVTKFGRYQRLLGPGRHRFNLFAETVKRVNLRTVCLNIPSQEMITADNLVVKIDGVCYYHVFDACKAAFEVDNYPHALSNLANVVLRTVLGEYSLAEIFTQRQRLNERLWQLLDEASEPWGLRVERVEIKGIEIEKRMQRAMAAKAEAQQEAEAKIIQARAQRDSAKILAEAASNMEERPMAMSLQWFETLRVIATQGKNTTVILPDKVEAGGP